MKTATVFLAAGLLLAAAWAVPAATNEPTSAAATEPATATSESATTEPTTSTSEPTTTATTESTTAPTSEPTTVAATEPATAPGESPVATMPASLPAEAARPVKSKVATFDDYRIVFDRNIFLKDRTTRRDRSYWHSPIRSTLPSQPATPQLVLTGVAIRDEVQVAFFENDQTGELVKAIVGDALQGGTVASISLDGVDFSLQGKTRKVAIGESLRGGGSVDMSSVRSSETTAGSGDGSGSNDDILERMKKRRAKELKP